MERFLLIWGVSIQKLAIPRNNELNGAQMVNQRKYPQVIALALLSVAIIVSIGHCIYKNNKYKEAFASTVIGDSESVVEERFGIPGVRKSLGQAFSAYESVGCKTPCVERLWWEAPFPIPRGFEAWAVDIDDAKHVVHKMHIVSP